MTRETLQGRVADGPDRCPDPAYRRVGSQTRPKAPDNSSVPPSQGRKPNRAERRAAKKRKGRPGVFRAASRAGLCASSPRAAQRGWVCALATVAPRSCPGSWAVGRVWLQARRYAGSGPRSGPSAPAPARSTRPWRVSRVHPTSSGRITRIYPCQPKSARSSSQTHNMCSPSAPSGSHPASGGEQLYPFQV